MLIVQIEPPNLVVQGDQLYRTVQPCRALAAAADDVYVLSGFWLSPATQQAALAADVLILCQAVDADFLPLLQARQAAGRPTVFEINDDFTAPQPWNPTASFCANPLMREISLLLAEQSTALQFSSRGLQQAFGQLNPRQILLPNQLERCPEPAPVRPSNKSPAVCLGFGGSYGHREDVRQIVPTLAALMKGFPQVRFACMVQAQMRPLFAALPQGRCRYVDPGDMAAYRRFVGSLDIGLAPLLPTPFNVGRSDVKFLEYSAGGAVAVCSAGPTYEDSVQHGENGMVFANPTELNDVLVRLVQDADLRARCVRQAQQQIKEGRLIAQHGPRQLQFLRDCLPAGMRRRQATAELTKTRFARLVAQHPAAEPLAPHYVRLAPGPAEAHLLAALHCADPAEACRRLQAPAIDRTNYLPHLFAAQRTPELRASLELLGEALHRAPRSCATLHAMALRLAQLGEVGAAKRTYQHILKLAPKWSAVRLGLDALG
jgi:hypothetical protein